MLSCFPASRPYPRPHCRLPPARSALAESRVATIRVRFSLSTAKVSCRQACQQSQQKERIYSSKTFMTHSLNTLRTLVWRGVPGPGSGESAHPLPRPQHHFNTTDSGLPNLRAAQVVELLLTRSHDVEPSTWSVCVCEEEEGDGGRPCPRARREPSYGDRPLPKDSLLKIGPVPYRTRAQVSPPFGDPLFYRSSCLAVSAGTQRI